MGNPKETARLWGGGNLTDMQERVRNEGQSRKEGACGLGHAPELLSPSVYSSVKWVHRLPVLCCGERAECMGSPSLSARSPPT